MVRQCGDGGIIIEYWVREARFLQGILVGLRAWEALFLLSCVTARNIKEHRDLSDTKRHVDHDQGRRNRALQTSSSRDDRLTESHNQQTITGQRKTQTDLDEVNINK